MKKILIVGGDARMKILYDELLRRGHVVESLGLFDGDIGTPDSTFDAVILPVPSTRDGKNVYCPLINRNIPLDLFDRMDEHVLLLTAAYIPHREHYIDYCSLDDYSLLNAVPTAEGAVSEAIIRTDYTIWNSRVLVIGYGRVGKVLADRLCGMRADVTVSARKPSDFAMLDTLGLSHIHTADVIKNIQNYDIIFNTVDHPVLNGAEEQLKKMLVIDLSTYGCVDADQMAKANIIKLPALPGRIAPKTAGSILSNVITRIIEGENL